MDFHVFTRRELQSLCKRNGLPANVTNVAMAEALEALEIVDGIDEIGKASPERSDLTSPYVPTAGRSTAQRTVVGKGTASMKTTRSTRKTNKLDLGKEGQSEGIQTPSVSQTGRKKGVIGSACRKIDAEMKNCVFEEEVIQATPANPDATSRRGRAKKQDTAVKSVYNTRRSARLAQKYGKQDIEWNENSGVPKMDLPVLECSEDATPKESHSEVDETSGITDVEEVKSEDKGDAEVVSVEAQELSTAIEDKAVTIEDFDAEIEQQATPTVPAFEISGMIQEDDDTKSSVKNTGNVGLQNETELEHTENVEGKQEPVPQVETSATKYSMVEMSVEENVMQSVESGLIEKWCADMEAVKAKYFSSAEPVVDLPTEDLGKKGIALQQNLSIEQESCYFGITSETSMNNDTGYEIEDQASAHLDAALVNSGDLFENGGNHSEAHIITTEMEKESSKEEEEIVQTNAEMDNGQAKMELIDGVDDGVLIKEEEGNVKRGVSSFKDVILDYLHQEEDPLTLETNEISQENQEELQRLSQKERDIQLSEGENTQQEAGKDAHIDNETPGVEGEETDLAASVETRVPNQDAPDLGGLNLKTPKRESATKKKFNAVASDNKENICGDGGGIIKHVITIERRKTKKTSGENDQKLTDLSMRRLKKEIKQKEARLALKEADQNNVELETSGY